MMLDKPTVAVRLARAFADRHVNNLNAGGRRDYYGFEVVNVADDLSAFDLVLTFRAQER